ncbi:MAG: PKD domain-containing protein [Bacteroidetes bacterium]|nr:PKD domain-containing protein [Bacteroidota bacterium]
MRVLIYLFLLLPLYAHGQTLIAHWDFNGTTNDISGNGLNGTGANLTSTTGYSGMPNTAYSFNGNSSKIDVPYNALMNLNTWSITALIKPTGYYSSTCQSNYILSRGHEYTGDYYALYFLDNPYDNSCTLFTPDSEVLQPMPAGTTPSYAGFKSGHFIHLNTWYCIASTYANDTIRVYIDGQLTASVYWPYQYGPGSTGALSIGYYNYGLPSYPYWYNGVIDDIQLYSGAMTQGQLDSLCNSLEGIVDTTVVYDFNRTVNCNSADFTAYYVSGNNATQYTWNFGDNTSATGNPASHIYSQSGTYTVTLVVMDALGHADTTTHTITVSTGNFNYNLSSTVQNCRTIQLSASYVNGDTATQFLWIFGDNSPLGNGQAVTHTYSQFGNYTVSLVVSNSFGCVDTLTLPVNLASIINYNVSDLQIDCRTAKLTATHISGDTTAQYLWIFNDNTTANSNPVTHDFGQSGSYTVKLVVSNAQGCTDTISHALTLSTNMNYNVASSVLDCKTARFTANHIAGDTAIQFIWIFSDNTTATGNPVTHIFPQNGYYTAVLVATNVQGCTDSIPQDIFLPFTTNYSITDSGINCKTAKLTAIHEGADTAMQFLWLFPDGQTDSGNPVTHTFPAPGNNAASLVIVNPAGCRDTLTDSFAIVSTVIADFTFEPVTPERNMPTHFHNASSANAIRFHWDFGDGSSSEEENPVKQFNRSGTFNVCLTASDTNDCSSMVCKPVEASVLELIGVPDAFSPNGDGKNDVLYVRGFGVKTMTVTIYDRWGQKMFATEDMNIGWDGTFKGAKQPADAYVYVLDATFESGHTFHKQGNITVLR